MKARTWHLIILLIVFSSLAQADVPPPRSVQVFFDENMQSNGLWVYNIQVYNFWVLAYDLPGGLSEYRFRLEFSDTTAIFGVGFPEGIINTGSGEDYVLQVTEPCPPVGGLVVLAEGIILPLPPSYLSDATLCLSPISDPGSEGSGLDYRACGSSAWEDLSLLYSGCAVMNPWDIWPDPIENNDPDGVVFNTISAEGEPSDVVPLTINLSTAMLKSGDPTALGHIELNLAWDPATAAYSGVEDFAPTGWTVTPAAGIGNLNLILSGETGLNPAFSATDLINVEFTLTELEGSSLVEVEIVELKDINGASVPHVDPESATITVACTKGDVVPNRNINALDALLTLEFAAQLQQPDAREFCRADMNTNGVIDSGDAAVILAVAVGLPTKVAGSMAGVQVTTTANTIRFDLGAATGVDLLVKWDPELGDLTNWSAHPSLQSAVRMGHGELQLAMARTVTTAAEIVLEFSQQNLTATLETAWFWDLAGTLVADRSGESFRLGQAIPRVAQLFSPAPNPFNPVTTIRYEMPNPGWAWVSVFDARGRRVWQTRVEAAHQGMNELTWAGIDEAGRSLASGSYLIVLETAGGRSTTRATLIK